MIVDDLCKDISKTFTPAEKEIIKVRFDPLRKWILQLPATVYKRELQQQYNVAIIAFVNGVRYGAKIMAKTIQRS